MKTPDAIEILVQNQAKALIAHGVCLADARNEAEERVAQVLLELEHLGLADVYIGVAMRRARVYQLRNQGLTIHSVQTRLGVSKNTVIDDYHAELRRLRERAS